MAVAKSSPPSCTQNHEVHTFKVWADCFKVEPQERPQLVTVAALRKGPFLDKNAGKSFLACLDAFRVRGAVSRKSGSCGKKSTQNVQMILEHCQKFQPEVLQGQWREDQRVLLLQEVKAFCQGTPQDESLLHGNRSHKRV